MENYVSYWKGKPITSLSKEELIEVIEYLSSLIERNKQDYNQVMKLAGLE